MNGGTSTSSSRSETSAAEPCELCVGVLDEAPTTPTGWGRAATTGCCAATCAPRGRSAAAGRGRARRRAPATPGCAVPAGCRATGPAPVPGSARRAAARRTGAVRPPGSRCRTRCGSRCRCAGCSRWSARSRRPCAPGDSGPGSACWPPAGRRRPGGAAHPGRDQSGRRGPLRGAERGRFELLVRRPAGLEPGGDDRDPHLVAERVVDHRAEDDVRLGVGRLLHQRGRLVDLEQTQVGAAGDGQQHALRAVHGRLQQRRVDRLARRPAPPGPRRATEPMPISALPAPDITDLTSAKSRLIRPGVVIRFGDALHTGEQHLIGRTECVHQGDAGVTELQQPVVRDDDQRVALVAQPLDAVLGLAGPPPALEGERAGDDADGQSAKLAGDRRNHRRAAGAGAAALAGGDEDHVGPLEDLLDLLAVVLGGLAAHLRVGPGTEAAGQLAADVELDVGVATSAAPARRC